jgi:4-hydroxy-tetrahydrodipicolinate synthase
MADGKVEKARAIHQKLFPLTEALFLETNPIPVKTALSFMDRCTDEMRLPLCPMSSENQNRLKSVMKNYGLL